MRHIITLPLLCLALGAVPLAWADSTEISPPNSQIMKPIATINTSDCIPSTPVIAIVKEAGLSAASAQDVTPPNSNCPTGYAASGLNANVKATMIGLSNATEYVWQINCCREVITYVKPA